MKLGISRRALRKVGYYKAVLLALVLLPVSVQAATLVSLTTCEKVADPGTTPVGVRDRFTPETTEINAVAVVTDLRAGTKVKGAWVAVDAIQTPNYEIDSAEGTVQEDGEATWRFSLSRPQKGWPFGNYKFQLYLDDKPFASAPFAVVAGTPGRGSVTFDFGPVRSDPNREWTVLVYLDGDNNLEHYALKDVDEMERALPPRGVEVIVLLDRAEGYSDEDGNWTDTRVFRVRPDRNPGIKSEVLATPGELNLGDPAVLQAFVSAALKTFPARRHALILWNHGGGWASHVTDEMAPGAPNNFDKLTLPKLRAALTGALREAGLRNLDLIGFDMCLMAQLETAYELEGVADVMVGSEASEPGDGWPYETVLPHFSNPALSTQDVARGIVKAYDDYYRPRQEPMATQSAFDLRYVGQVVDTLDAFLTKVESTLPGTWPSLTRAMFFSESYSDVGDMRRGAGALLSVDLGNAFHNLVSVQPSLRSTPEYTALRNALGQFVLASKNSHRHQKSQGVAMYAPFRADLLNKDYLNTRFAKKSRWPKALSQLYAIQTRTPSEPTIGGVETVSLLRQQRVSEVIQLGQDGFAFQFEGKNLLWAFAAIGVRDDAKRQTFIFEKSILRKEDKDEGLRVEKKSRPEVLDQYGYTDGPHRVGFRYDGTRHLVSNGEKAFLVTTDETNVGNLGGHLIAVPAIYEHPKVGKYYATIYFNWLWRAAAVKLEIPQKDGSYVYARIDPQPDANIHLLVEAWPDQGQQTYVVSGTLAWKSGLFLTIDLAPPGEHEVFLTLESLTGFSKAARHRFRVAARDDDLLKGVQNAPDELIPENFIGEWEYIDAEQWFKRGRMVSIGAFATYEPHPMHKNLLKFTLYKPRGKNLLPALDMVEVIQRQGLPHLRQYVLDDQGAPRPEYGYRMSFPVFDYKDGQYLILQMDLATGELGVKVKRNGPTPKLQTYSPQTPGSTPPPGAMTPPGGMAPPGGASMGLGGAWRSDEGDGVVFQGNQWAFYEGGRMVDGGIFQIQGNQLMTRSARTGEVRAYLFQMSGNQLLIQDDGGEVHRFTRVK